jgi:hypothetical protein
MACEQREEHFNHSVVARLVGGAYAKCDWDPHFHGCIACSEHCKRPQSVPAEIPRVLILHRSNLPDGDTQEMFGVRCTKPLRTIMDLVVDGKADKTLLRQAIQEALARGLMI